jgi:hypothetical protein
MIDLYYTEHGTLAVSSEPGTCKVCGRATFMLINQNGETSCVCCAQEIRREQVAA